MFGLNEAMLSFLRRQVGLRTDSASSSGSVHAKLGELREYVNTRVDEVINTVQKPRTTYKGTYSTTSRSYVTALNISGKGMLRCLKYLTTRDTCDVYLKVTIDGRQIISFNDGYSKDQWQWVAPDLDSGGPSGPYDIHVAFNQSLKIQIMSGDGSTVKVHWVYEKEE